MSAEWKGHWLHRQLETNAWLEAGRGVGDSHSKQTLFTFFQKILINFP
jgi:hypothetical protein